MKFRGREGFQNGGRYEQQPGQLPRSVVCAKVGVIYSAAMAHAIQVEGPARRARPGVHHLKTVALLASLGKRKAISAARQIASNLEKRGLRVRVGKREAELLGLERLCCKEEELAEEADLVIAVGGDGTMLTAARMAAPRGVPVLGVHVGGLGFLTEVLIKDLPRVLNRVVHGQFEVHERIMLEARVVRRGKEIQSVLGLNDMVVTKGAFSRLLRLKMSVDGKEFASLAMDGVIVSSPTGSTAYSLSAGGPLVEPGVPVLMITPICPHTLSARPLVVSADSEVAIQLPTLTGNQEAMATIDGQLGIPLASRDRVLVRKSPHPARLVSLGGPSFLPKLRSKLGWGAHP
jgi:NAD+ kinase